MHTTKQKERKGTLMSMRDLQHETGKSRQWVYNQIQKDPSFPRPVKLGEFSVAWIRSEFEAWVASRPRAEPCGLSAVERRELARTQQAASQGGAAKPVKKALGVIL